MVEMQSSLRVALAVLGMSVGGALFGACLLVQQRNPTEMSLSRGGLSLSESFEHSVSIYKRTYVSPDPFADGQFVTSMLGMQEVVSQTEMEKGVENATCAHREVVSNLDGFQLHFFRTYRYPSREEARRWTASWREQHAQLAPETWDVFATPSVTMYSPWISPFLRRFEDAGVDHMRYFQHYDDDTTLFSLIVAIPNAGLTIEIVSTEDLNSDDRATFMAIPDSMCAAALTMLQTPSSLETIYAELGGAISNDHGVPDLIFVSMTFPTSDIDAFAGFFLNIFSGIDVNLDYSSLPSETCSAWAVKLVSSRTNPGSSDDRRPVYIKAVANSAVSQGNGDYTLDRLEREVRDAHETYMAQPNTGWDAYIDNHVGMHISQVSGQYPATTLLPGILAHHNEQFNMHPRCTGCFGGSLWGSGLGAWSVEIQAEFDKADNFNHLSNIDYCSPTTNGNITDNYAIVATRV